jgi:hypothetical protein
MTGHMPATTFLRYAKDALENQLHPLDISPSIWDSNAIIDLAGCSSVYFASGVRLFRQQRGESFAL